MQIPPPDITYRTIAAELSERAVLADGRRLVGVALRHSTHAHCEVADRISRLEHVLGVSQANTTGGCRVLLRRLSPCFARTKLPTRGTRPSLRIVGTRLR